MKNFVPEKERCWIACVADERVGSVMVVQDRAIPDTARIRLLYVCPAARGLGLGQKLTDQCILFSKAAGYKRMTLWTHRY